MVYRILVLILGHIVAQHADANGWTRTTANTGLAGVGLTCDSLPTYTGPSKPAAGTTISLQKITYEELILSNGNITLDRVCVKPTSVSNRMGVVFGYNPDTGDDQLGDVTIKDSDIDGSLVTNSSVYTACGFRGAGSVYRTKIWGLGNGICYFGAPTVSSSVIEGNYVFGLRSGMYGSPPQQSHNESGTIRSFLGTSLVWRNNYLESRSGADSGALFIQTISGNIQNVLITGNLFDTMAWGMPLEAAYGNTYSNMSATNNRFSPTSGAFGAAYVTGGPGWAVWSGNVRYNIASATIGSTVACPGGACAAGSNVSPTVSITSPTNGASIVVNTSQTITATASDSDGTVSQVVFKANGTTLGADSMAPYSFSWTPTSTGAVVLTAEATDNGGAVTTSELVNVTVTTATATCSLDFNGDGTVNTTDALLFSRWLLGFRNATLVNGITPHPAGTSETAFANAVASRMTLGSVHDFDDDTRLLAETDGLLLLRLTRGLAGTAVTSGAVGSGATRATHEAIRTHINRSCGTNFPGAPSAAVQRFD